MAEIQRRQIKESFGSRAFDVVNIIILALLSLVCLYPVWYVLVASVSDGNLLMQHTGGLLKPLGFSLGAYKKVFQNPMIMQGYLNTLKILAMSMVVQLTMTAIGAYFFSRSNVMFKRPLMILITITMFINGGMIPFYQTLQDLRLLETHLGLVIPFAIST